MSHSNLLKEIPMLKTNVCLYEKLKFTDTYSSVNISCYSRGKWVIKFLFSCNLPLVIGRVSAKNLEGLKDYYFSFSTGYIIAEDP